MRVAVISPRLARNPPIIGQPVVQEHVSIDPTPTEGITMPPQSPPAETGQRLVCLPRGEDEQLRITWSEYQGHKFVAVRMWTRDRQNRWWPDSRRGCSFRVKELGLVVKALNEALQLAEEQGAQWEPIPAARPTRRTPQARRRPSAEPRTEGPIRTLGRDQAEFSEF